MAWISFEKKSQYVSAEQVYFYVQDFGNDLSLLSLYDLWVATLSIKSTTLVNYRVTRGNLAKFLADKKTSDLPAKNFSVKMADDFFQFVKSFSGQAHAVRQVRRVKACLKWAASANRIANNPLQSWVKNVQGHKKADCLSHEQVNLIRRHRFASSRLQKVAWLFLLQCCTGAAYVDLHQVTLDRIRKEQGKEFFLIERAKTGSLAWVPVCQEAKDLLNRMGGAPEILSNQKYNAFLKEIAEIVGIEIRVTTHTGRRTFGQLKIDEGFSLEAVAAMMGHKSTRVTESSYVRFSLNRVLLELNQRA